LHPHQAQSDHAAISPVKATQPFEYRFGAHIRPVKEKRTGISGAGSLAILPHFLKYVSEMIHCLDPYALIGCKTAESDAAMIGALSSTPLAIARKRERVPSGEIRISA